MELLDVLACPRCHAPLTEQGANLACKNETCALSSRVFPSLGSKPILIDLDRSIVDRNIALAREAKSHVERSALSHTRLYRLVKMLSGSNRVAAANARELLDRLKAAVRRPAVLVIGGGTRGIGADALWADREIDLLSFDVYDSPNVQFLADAHHIPLRDLSIDGVWIQAVLEHVLDPNLVASEIHRILRTNGLVYAETPFMQQVHEFQYDFFRVSHSAHRWLFRGFDELKSGPVGGAGTVLNWSIKYLVWCVTGSRTASRIASLCFAWLRIFDGLGSRRRRLDSASGLYFLGRKSETALAPRNMVAYYDGQ